MKDLKKKLNAFMQVCYHLMVGNQPKTQEEAYICICDTLVMFRYLATFQYTCFIKHHEWK